MKKHSIGTILIVLSLSFVLLLSACNKVDNDNEIKLSTGYDDSRVYTYNTSTTVFGDDWNPHTWQDSGDSDVLAYVSSGLYEFKFTEDKSAATLYPEMAANDPVDVTSSLTSAQKAKYGVPSAATEQWAYQIDLNQAAKWQDGTSIKADEYVNSLERLLRPEYLNSRADSEMSGDAAIAGAVGYFNQGKVSYIKGSASSNTTLGTVYISFSNVVAWWGDGSMQEYYDAYFPSNPEYFTVNGVDIYTKWKAIAGENEYYHLIANELTEFEADFSALCNAVGGGYDGEWKEFVFVANDFRDTKYTDFTNVGIIKNNDYSITIVYAQPLSAFNAKYYNTSTWLIKVDEYDRLTTTVGDNLKKTTYNSSVDTTYSYGPYFLKSYEANKEMVYERNTNWHGYSDGKHVGQYSTDIVRVKLIAQQATELIEFLKGGLDSTSLTASDLTTYGTSEYKDVIPETYLYRFFYNLDLDKLKAFDASTSTDSNTVALTSEKFRLALSAAINRAEYAKITNNKTAFGLISDLYTYDYEGEMADGQNYRYRDLDVAKQAILDIYGVEWGEGKQFDTLDEAYNSITGFDFDLAKSLFKEAYDELLADKANNGFNENKTINIRIGYSPSPLNPTAIALQTELNKQFAAAIADSGFKGLTFEFVVDTNRYDAVRKDPVRLPAAFGAIGGARQDPFGTASTFLDPDDSLFLGYGIPLATETLSLTYDFDNNPATADETITMSFADWGKALKDQNQYLNSHYSVKAYILSRLEYEYLKRGYTTPMGSSVVSELHSMRIVYPIEEYNQMIGFGGLQYMQYKYDDAAWAKFVEANSKNGQLQYV